jgi:hypothetical protein
MIILRGISTVVIISGYATLKVYPEYADDRPPEADKPIRGTKDWLTF